MKLASEVGKENCLGLFKLAVIVGNRAAVCTALHCATWEAPTLAGCFLPSCRKSGSVPVHAARARASQVFAAIVQGALEDAVEGALEDEEEGEAAGETGAAEAREEWLARVAAVGRGDCVPSMALLTQLIAQKKGELQQCSARGRDPSALLEELCWLVRASAHMVADTRRARPR
eukprot:jgi/Botrbrau1/17082/Bobra.0647s0004.1